MQDSQHLAKKRAAFVGDEGLYQLWLQAIDQYIDSVRNNRILYNLFVEDFINAHTFHDGNDSYSKNEHQKNLGRMRLFLETRRDLLESYASVNDHSYESFLSCMKEFMVLQKKESGGNSDFSCLLSAETIAVITNAVNDIRLFESAVTIQDMDRFFNKCMPCESGPLVSSYNGALAYFMCQLNNSGIIGSYYQKVIAEHGLIKSSSRKKMLTQTDLSASLHKFCNQVNPIREKIDAWVFAVKEVYFGTKLPK